MSGWSFLSIFLASALISILLKRWDYPLMGWTSSADPVQALNLRFSSIEAAIRHAEESGKYVFQFTCLLFTYHAFFFCRIYVSCGRTSCGITSERKELRGQLQIQKAYLVCLSFSIHMHAYSCYLGRSFYDAQQLSYVLPSLSLDSDPLDSFIRKLPQRTPKDKQ